ncbi:hypothetical protein GOP47_0020642 [Adiantum capillus-veneris]|uniref:Uncharacterized protein n=1 Tax=Adiantum capillus-veneris TaxID=13818 RepID=A0A9D4UAC4_ADICA|nr:hypothetical protein GOP47_0020642 [Adiantum capillus-veneris]
MHGVDVERKAPTQDVPENVVKMESNSQVVANLNEYEVEQSELSQKGENGGVAPYQADKVSFHEEGHTGNNNVEEVHVEHGGVADPQYYAQHHGHSASAENCYLCQWNAYYNQSGALTSQAACCSNGLRCQYCGYVNQFDDGAKTYSQTPRTSQVLPDASAFPDIIKAAVAEALKTTEGQNSTSTVTESSQTRSSFSDVATAWFLAGFHTSRYLSQSK